MQIAQVGEIVKTPQMQLEEAEFNIFLFVQSCLSANHHSLTGTKSLLFLKITEQKEIQKASLAEKSCNCMQLLGMQYRHIFMLSLIHG